MYCFGKINIVLYGRRKLCIYQIERVSQVERGMPNPTHRAESGLLQNRAKVEREHVEHVGMERCRERAPEFHKCWLPDPEHVETRRKVESKFLCGREIVSHNDLSDIT